MANKKKISDDSPAVHTKKTSAKNKYKYLLAEYSNIWEVGSNDDHDHAYSFAEEYKTFLDQAKTEREFVCQSIEAAEQLGFSDICACSELKPGQKVYQSIKNKGIMLAVIGKRPVTDGFNILGAHIDSPRLDLKPNPMCEEDELVYFKTHYYGGIKKYQWTAIPLAIHGLISRKDGSSIYLNIGENEDDPIFYITDLLPHLGSDQMSRKGSDLIRGEELTVVIGGRPVKEKDIAQSYKIGILKILNEQYGIVEKDFVSAELEIVPAQKARDVGFDRSFVAAYGHDDKVCAYPALMALFEQERPEKTIVCMFSDKEETGSNGNTGAQSRLYENFLAEVFAKIVGEYDELAFRKTITASKMLSADVSNGYDPKYSSVSDPKNSAYLSHGIKLEKYVGSKGKSGTNDANSEYFSAVIRIFEKRGIYWQTGELGKVDEGGGGTISVFMSKLGMEVIDCGVPVLSMHSPYELISKIDLYYTYLAYKAFIEEM